MASVEKISIALPPEMVSLVRQAVETGEYASSSEVVRDALRDWSHKRTLRQQGIEELREVWQQAMEDHSPGVPADSFALGGLFRLGFVSIAAFSQAGTLKRAVPCRFMGSIPRDVGY